MENAFCSHPGCKNQHVAMAVVVFPDGGLSQTNFCKDHLKDLGMDLLPPDLSQYEYQPYGSYEEFTLHAILFFYEGNQYHVVLKSLESNAIFYVPISYFQAMAIFYAATKQNTTEYPLIHQVLTAFVQRLGGSPREIVVYGYNKYQDAYDCYFGVATDDELIKNKCMVGDAIALSIHAGIPVKINSAFFGKDSKAVDR